MDDREFRRLLDLFPVVRSRNYCADSESSRQSTSQSTRDEVSEWKKEWNEMDNRSDLEEICGEDPFWVNLRLAAERKMGPGKAEHFCKAVERVHKELVIKGLSSDAAQRFIDGGGN